jgi:integrase
VIALPEHLAKRVDKLGTPTRKLAHVYQTAVAVELFLMTALRIGNVANLAIGKDLLLRKDGGIDILLTSGDVKNGVQFTADLPPSSAAMIRRYITKYRPLLGDPASPWLFPGQRAGAAKISGALREQVVRAMARECGLKWHPHLFRHLLAQVILTDNPAADAVVTRALGHKNSDGTRRNYSGFQTKAALRLYDDLVLRRRSAISVTNKRKAQK